MSSASTSSSLGRWLLLAGLAAATAAGALGCAAPYRIPSGSRPLAQAPSPAHPDWTTLLPGTWDVRAALAPQSPTYAGNLIRRSADMAGVSDWRQLIFAPARDGGATLELRDGGVTRQLDYRIEDDLVAIGPENPQLSHEHWQPNYANGLLYLRSLSDGEVLTLARAR